MIRKSLLLTLLFLLYAPFASATETEDLKLYGSITQSESEDLNIDIPLDLAPGYKSFEIEVTGMGQAPLLQTILFCKGLDGLIHWDNKCNDLIDFEIETVPIPIKSVDSLPLYDPYKNSKATTNTAIIAFATLSVLMSAGALTNRNLSKAKSNSEVDKPGYLAGLSKGVALVATTQLGRGDKSNIWKKPINQKLDRAISNSGTRISGFSPLATRIISDGNYQRSLIGPLSLIIYPVSIAVGIFASLSLQQAALPPSLGFILLMMLIGVSDALAGVLISLTFILAVLIGGHLTSLDSLLTVAGVCLLAFSPALIAGAFRPFRRAVWDFTSLWERITDYLLASILTGWVVQQIVLGLPGLSGLQLPIAKEARTIALFAVVLVLIRFSLEDLSIRLFPQRLMALEPQYRERTIAQQLFAAALKIAIFAVMAEKFIGFSAELLIGIALFCAPLLMGIFADRFPKSAALQKWMPTGIIEMLVMTIGGYFLAIAVKSRYPEARSYVLVSFVLLSLPGFILKILALFGKDSAEDWRITKFGKTTYRLLGVVALSILIYIILSGLLVSNLV
jgi:hypothetical protein